MKKALYIISILLVFCECILLAKEYTDTIENFRNMRALAKLIKVRDGDTFVITIEDTPDVFGEEIAVRIRGIDTPELNDKREEIKAIAIKAKEELERLLTSGKKIVLYNLGRDKYFRLLASVKVGDIDVAEYLIKRGLAKEYDAIGTQSAEELKFGDFVNYSSKPFPSSANCECQKIFLYSLILRSCGQSPYRLFCIAIRLFFVPV